MLLKYLDEEHAVCLYVDALDEIERFADSNIKSSYISVCFASRHYPSYLFESTYEVTVEKQNASDIKLFIEASLGIQKLRQAVSDPEKIVEAILKRANNRFQWSTIVVKRALTMIKQGYNTTALLKMIGNTPQELKALYGYLLGQIDPNYEVECLRFPQAIHDFSKLDWFRGYNLQLRLQLLREPSLGLYEMHEKGIMHRDITIGNILVLSYDPPQAVINDFGKAIHKPDNNDTCIGPIASLAPEVWTAKEGEPYNNAIDVWAYGHAVAKVLKCGGNYTQKDHSEGITKETHAYILKKLGSHAR